MQALQGLRILDLTSLWPGPLATMLLADLGADVLRVDAPDRPDLLRFLPPLDEQGESYAWRMVGRNKRSIGLNLKHPDGRAVLSKLVQRYDIVVEQFRPGVLDRLGVGYAQLSALQPRLIWCAISAFGQTGPLRDRPGHDIDFLALSGAASHLGRPGSGPSSWITLPGDVAGGTWPAVAGILAAALHREATGRGQLVDIAMADGALLLNCMAASAALAGQDEAAPGHGVLGGGSPYDYYRTRDGRFLAVGALEPKFWAEFCGALGRPDLLELAADDAASMAALKAEVARIIADRDLQAWTEVFDGVGCCVEPVLTSAEAVQRPQVAARQMVVGVPTQDGAETRQIGNPIRLSASPAAYRRAAVAPGHDTAAVLAELGIAADTAQALRSAGAVTYAQ